MTESECFLYDTPDYPVYMSASDVSVALMEGEQVEINESPSIAAYLTQNFLVSLITFGIAPLLYAKQSSFVVTDERVILRTGILRTDTTEYRIEDIQQINTGQSIIEKLLGAGNVTFSTAATSTDITFYGLKDYQSVTNTIRNYQRES